MNDDVGFFDDTDDPDGESGPWPADRPGALADEALRRCKQAVRALPAEGRRQFDLWVARGMPED